MLPHVTQILVEALERDATPVKRPKLLREFRDSLADRGVTSPVVNAALERWNAEPAYDDEPAYQESALPDYFSLESFDDIERAITVDRKRREAQTSIHYGNFVNGKLGKRIGRIIAAKPWHEVEEFAARHPKLIGDAPVKEALAKVALAAGQRAYAETLLAVDLQDRDGWGGWGGSGRFQVHRARHLLGAEHAHELARAEFVGDLAGGGRGTGTALWDIDEIFPLLYREIDWPALWDRLAEQIDGYRDFRKVPPIPRENDGTLDDIDLLARLFAEAAGFGVTDSREQATDGALNLLRTGSIETFYRVCRGFIEGDADEILLGARILLEARQGQGWPTPSCRTCSF